MSIKIDYFIKKNFLRGNFMTKKKSFIFKMTLLALLLACIVGFFVSLAPSTSDASADVTTSDVKTEDTEDVNYDDQIETYSANTEKFNYPLSLENSIMTDSRIETSFYTTGSSPYISVKVYLSDANLEYFEDIVMNLNQGNFALFACESETLFNSVSKYSTYNSGNWGAQTGLLHYYPSAMESMGLYSFQTRKNLNLFSDGCFSFAVSITNLNFNKPIYLFGGFTYELVGTGEEQYVGTLCKTPLVSINPYNDLLNSLKNPTISDKYTYQEYAKKVQKIMGIYHEEDATINIKYLKSAGENTRGQFSNVTEMVSIPSYMLQAKDKVVAEIQKSDKLTDLNNYNIVETCYYYEEDENDENSSFFTGAQIIRQAIDYEYTYDSENNTGTIEIIYSDFYAKDLYVRVTNNDINNKLSIDVKAVRVKTNDGMITATFLYQDICTEMQNLCGWLPGRWEGEGDDKAFIPGILKDNVEVTIHGDNTGVSVTFDNTGIYITCAENNQNALALVQLDIVMMLVEDLDLMFSYRYVSLNDRLEETVITSTPEIKKYSKILAISNNSFIEKYGELINMAINPSSLKGQPYMTYKGVKKIYDKDNKTYIFEVEYDRANMLVVNNDKNDNCVYKVLDANSLYYLLSDFVSNSYIPEGWRIYKLESSDGDLKILNYSDKTPLDTQVLVNWNTSNSKTVYLTCKLTDKWVLDIEYFMQYKDSPFLEKKTMNKEIRVLDYKNVYELSVEELKAIMGIETFDLLNLVTVDSLDVTFKGSGYNVVVNYTHASLKKTDYNGNIDEVKVYITPYSKWTEAFGKDWSILFLNTPGNKFFNYSNDLEKENLYGFFSVAIMEERVSDLNRIFSEYSANGCKTVYQSQEVTGSNVYKFFGNTVDGLQQVGMFLCEIFNADNKIYHSYFFYLDGTSDMSYLATNGADSYDDESSAFQNKWENFTDGVSDVWNTIDSYVYLVLAIAGIILGLVLTVKLMSIVWAGTMQITFKIITTVIVVGVWVVIGIIVVPWAVGLIGAL